MPANMFFPQMWGDKTIESMIRAMKERQYIVNSIQDYTNHTKDKQANAYNGPRIGLLKAVNLPATKAESLAKSSITINFDQKKGVVFSIGDIEQSQTNINLVQEATGNAKDALIDGYDDFIVRSMIKGAGSKLVLSGAKILKDEFMQARKVLNAKKAPKKGRYATLCVEHEAELYNIEGFISRDKIKDTDALKEGVIGRLLGFDIILYQDMPKVNSTGVISETDTENTKNVSLFYQSMGYGFGRQKEFGIANATNVLIPATEINIFSVFGGTIQEADYIVSIRDK